jgi:hypothetical protein
MELNNERLTPRQEAAILALIGEPSVARAAAVAKVGERTLHNWLTDPYFMREFRRYRRIAFSQAISISQRFAPLAVNTLAKIMHDEKAAASARVAAAVAVLKFSRESIELDDLTSRIEALEDAANGITRTYKAPPDTDDDGDDNGDGGGDAGDDGGNNDLEDAARGGRACGPS